MKRYPFLFFTLLLLSCCAAQSVTLKPGIQIRQLKKIAVIGFSDAPGVSGTGLMVTEILEKNLLKAGFDMIDHAQLENLLAANHVVITSPLNRGQLRQLREISGVDAVMVGLVTQAVPEQGLTSGGDPRFIAAQARLECRMLSTLTGDTLMSGVGSYDAMNMQTAFEYLIASLVNRFTNALPTGK